MVKSGTKDTIQHEGTVKKVENGSVLVSIKTGSACSGCHAESICNLAGQEERIIEVKGNYGVAQGDRVVVLMKQSVGYKAVVLSYIIPFAIVIAGLIIFNYLSTNEILAGLGSIFLLLPYFLILYLFRSKINRNFSFMLKT
jgi:positive regulator of sigma E activity